MVLLGPVLSGCLVRLLHQNGRMLTRGLAYLSSTRPVTWWNVLPFAVVKSSPWSTLWKHLFPSQFSMGMQCLGEDEIVRHPKKLLLSFDLSISEFHFVLPAWTMKCTWKYVASQWTTEQLHVSRCIKDFRALAEDCAVLDLLISLTDFLSFKQQMLLVKARRHMP